jgi:hypothetical protein
MPHLAADDIAVVTFAKDGAPGIGRLATAPLVDGAPLTLVGYGATDLDSIADAGTRRMGRNTFVAADQGSFPGMIVVFGPHGPRSMDPRAGASRGDSGGPLLSGDGHTISGVTSGGGFRRGATAQRRVHCDEFDADCGTLFVDVLNDRAAPFLARALAGAPPPTAAGASLTEAEAEPAGAESDYPRVSAHAYCASDRQSLFPLPTIGGVAPAGCDRDFDVWVDRFCPGATDDDEGARASYRAAACVPM